MIEAFLSTYFDNPAGETVKPNLKIHHPVIQKIYEEYGVCASKDGFYRIVDPEEWQEHYMPWFLFIRDEEEVFRGPELYPFITTAFGHAYIFANLEDEDLVGYVSVNDNFHAMGDAGGFFTENLLDPIFYKFNLHGDLYEELSPIEPPLTQDECFGFFPPISLGGEAVIENVQRVKLREHLYFLAQASGLPEE
ncbi:hypothetical protein Dxin01_03737 [Deinococcus xinjiangensis]|uniref:T6SS immunity protein Tdi1 C-terminal domain-containing protein n=1 Tax=Deinococcus xinjiangensis TaxID=457454 RepID=A0ABP9VFG3_9DEIO